jgi:hypothetical protein
MQTGGIKEEINREDINALDEYVRGELFHEINPDMSQVLVLAKRLLEDLEDYHYNALENGELSFQQHRIWKRDAKQVTKALMALRQVAEG